ncbi:putative glutathione synthetase isoform X2 [Apostichopus japonicus]|uniref:Glutathione synthetase n=1 Tax=Stichopus japonicus TaxID=307972 RepID=A0A2G8K5W2_STIJA|nr:putative glutathione synthetase isoform X2 [Apostichopus japonicus]
MSPPLPSCVEVPVLLSKLNQTVKDAKDLACLNGFLMRTKENPDSSDVVSPAPFMLLPSSIPKHLFQTALSIQPSINELYFKVANDYDFLWKTLEGTINVDEFTAKQWEIMKQVQTSGKKKSLQVGMLRSDYMLDTAKSYDLSLSQVEVNTIAASFAGLASKIAPTHRLIIRQLSPETDVSKVPLNNACSGLSEALYLAWKAYGNPQAVVVVFVDEDERNIFDQRCQEVAITDFDPTIKVWRRSMEYVGANANLTEDDRITLDNEEVAVFYYRTGYVPTQFKSDLDAEGDAAAEKAIANPDKFVMKPQLEGGGNNIYKEEIRTTLQKTAGTADRSKYILMDRIIPHSVKNYVIRPGYSHTETADYVSEFGFYGSFVSLDDKVLLNKAAGHQVRTKQKNQDEGGVAVGVSSLNSPFLV